MMSHQIGRSAVSGALHCISLIMLAHLKGNNCLCDHVGQADIGCEMPGRQSKTILSEILHLSSFSGMFQFFLCRS